MRTSRAGSRTRAPGVTARLGSHWSGTTLCPPYTAGCAITRARAVAIARRLTRPSPYTPSSASSATSPRRRVGSCRVEAPPSGKRVLVVGAGPSGLAAAYHLARRGHSVEIHEAGPLPGGMLHFGIPAYRLPREDLMKEVRRDRGDGCQDRLRPQGREPARRESLRTASMRCSSRSARAPPSMSISRRAMRRGCSMPFRFCTMSVAESPRASGAASSSTGAATRRWMRPARRGVSARRMRSSSTGATARTCRRAPSRPTRRSRKACASSGSPRSGRSWEPSSRSRRWSSMPMGGRGRPGESSGSRPMRSCSPWVRSPTAPSCGTCQTSTSAVTE